MTDHHHQDHEKDRELMLRIRERDMGAYQQLVTKYLSRCTRFAERMLGEQGDAKDVAQEVCLKIWNEPESWQPTPTARFSTWLYRVLFNACIDYKRKKRPGGEAGLELLEDETPDQEQMLMARQEIKEVREAIQQLPERQRAVLVLCYYEEVSNQQAAEALGLTVGAVQQLLFRARQNLKLLLLPSAAEMEKAYG